MTGHFFRWFNILTRIILISPGLIIFLLLIINIDKGLDITDEGHYLGHAINAWVNYPTTTQYGHYTGILLKLVGGHLVNFRILGIIILSLLSIFLALSFESFLNRVSEIRFSRIQSAQNCSLVCAGSLIYYYMWTPTPSYNWLLLVGSLIFLIGLFGLVGYSTAQRFEYRQIGLCMVCAFGFHLMIMAKFPGAVIGLLITLLLLIITENLSRLRFLVLWIFGALALFLLLHSYVFATGPWSFYQEMQFAVNNTLSSGAGYQLHDVITATARGVVTLCTRVLPNFIVPIVIGGIALIFFKYQWIPFGLKLRKPQILSRLLTLLFILSIGTVLYFNNLIHGGHKNGMDSGYSLFVSGAIIFLYTFSFFRFTERKKENRARILPFYYLAFIIILPAILSFGSNNNLFRMSTSFSGLIMIGIIYSIHMISVGSHYKLISSAISILIFWISFVMITGGLKNPYRVLGSLENQTKPVKFIGNQATFFVDPKTELYISGLVELAESNDWLQGNPLLDLTGGTPLAATILNAYPVGSPWVVGGYRGSDDRALRTLKRESEENLNAAWIISAPEGSRKLSDSLVQNLGINFPSNYEQLGVLNTGHRNEVQMLWRPITLD